GLLLVSPQDMPVRRRLLDSPVAGARLLVLVPEQAALQTERALIADPRLGSSHRAEVMGFARLAERILADGLPLERVALSLNGRAMTLRYLMGRLQGRLQYYRRAERFGGFIEHLAQAVGELFQEAVEPQDLADAAAASDDPIQSRKLADLHLLYTAYREYLGDQKVDPSQYLDLARQRVDRTPWLTGAEIWVDGFAGYTRTESLLLARLASVASGVQVTVMADPDQIKPAASGSAPPDPTSLFAKPLRTLSRLTDVFSGTGIEVIEPVNLRPDPPPRFAHNPRLAYMERHLFGDESTGPGHEPDNPRAGPLGVELVGLPDRRSEVAYAVSRVCQWVQREENPLRYRDIALICRDLEPYHDLISAALNESGIPYFIDRRRPIAHHPLVELLGSLVAIAREDLSVDSVRLIVKTDLLGVSQQAADELENFLLAYGIAGLSLWNGPSWNPVSKECRVGELNQPAPTPGANQQDLARRVNATRRHLMAKLGDWLATAQSDAPANGREWARRIAEVLDKLSVADRLERWAQSAEQDGDLDAAEEHRQVWRDVVTFIDDLADALADQTLTLDELAVVLQAGLSQFTLGLAPPMIDQILVGAIERSRHPAIKAAVVLGFNDSIFPFTGSEGAILNDEDRTWLAEQGLVVGTPRRQRILEERLLVYVALTRASQTTVVTWPATDEQGVPLRISPFAADLRAGCDRLLEKIEPDPLIHRRLETLRTAGDVAARLALEFRARPESPDGDGPIRTSWNGLYESARADPALSGPLGRALKSLTYANNAVLSPGVVDRLIDKPLTASVSRLERFAACPFQHFADYHLKLSERPQAELADVDVGKLHHAILEDLVQHLVDQGQSLGQLDEPALLDRLKKSTERIGLRPALAQSRTVARQAYQLRRNREELARVLRAQRQVASLGRFRSQGT
ncbi:MAG: PD-(D/E)XK nuclease family protein, partial [Phycisphaerae bacterium]